MIVELYGDPEAVDHTGDADRLLGRELTHGSRMEDRVIGRHDTRRVGDLGQVELNGSATARWEQAVDNDLEGAQVALFECLVQKRLDHRLRLAIEQPLGEKRRPVATARRPAGWITRDPLGEALPPGPGRFGLASISLISQTSFLE